MRFILASAILMAVLLSETTAQQYNNYNQQQNQQYGQRPQGGNNYYPQQQNNNNNYYKKSSYQNKNTCAPVDLGCVLVDGLPCEEVLEVRAVKDVSLSIPLKFLFDYQYYITSSTNMTNFYCYTFCAGNYFPYSITYNGDSCFCGTLNCYKPVNESQCNAGCTGNSTERCGSTGIDGEGCHAVNLYATPANCVPKILSIASTIYPFMCDSKVVQCSNFDDPSFEASYVNTYTNIPISSNEYCAALCTIEAYIFSFSLTDTYGYTYSGTFNGTGCVCIYSPGAPYDWSNCNVPCSGDFSQKCGDATNTYYTVSTTQIGCGLRALYDQNHKQYY